MSQDGRVGVVLGLPKRTLIVIAVLVGVIVLYVLGSDKRAKDANSASPATPAANATQCRVSVTADVLSEIYFGLLKAYHGDSLDYDDSAQSTWARIPHFYSTPYYVYQYATCFASSAQIMRQITSGAASARAEATDRYLTMLKAGGSDHPMTLLQRAGVDLSRPETVRAVVDQLDALVTKLERAISR